MTENNTTAGDKPAAAGASSSGRGSHPDYSTNGSGAHPPSSDDLLGELERLAEAARVEPPPAGGGKLSAEDAAFLLSAGLHDEGNAACVERLFPGQFLHNAAFGWLAYTGSHWVIEGAEELLDRAVVHSLARRIEAASQPETFESGGRCESLRCRIVDAWRARKPCS